MKKMNNIDALRISQQRDAICDWVEDRFFQLIKEERHDDAIDFANEYIEWMNPDLYINESTHFFNQHELTELYESITNG